jgi:hypothetical protein
MNPGRQAEKHAPGRCAKPAVLESELPLYRQRTLAVLRRYFRLAMATGRLPSLLGREFFRARVTSYRLHTFEDAVIFTHDVERCLERLDAMSKQLIARIVLQGHTEEETAHLLQCTRRHVVRLYPEALDRLSAILLEVNLLSPGLSSADESGTAREEEKAAEPTSIDCQASAEPEWAQLPKKAAGRVKWQPEPIWAGARRCQVGKDGPIFASA